MVNEIFSKIQFGFRKEMGTEAALSNYVDHLQNFLNIVSILNML